MPETLPSRLSDIVQGHFRVYMGNFQNVILVNMHQSVAFVPARLD